MALLAAALSWPVDCADCWEEKPFHAGLAWPASREREVCGEPLVPGEGDPWGRSARQPSVAPDSAAPPLAPMAGGGYLSGSIIAAET